MIITLVRMVSFNSICSIRISICFKRMSRYSRVSKEYTLLHKLHHRHGSDDESTKGKYHRAEANC